MKRLAIEQGFYSVANSNNMDFVNLTSKIVENLHGERNIPAGFYSNAEPIPTPDIRNRLQKLYFDRTFLNKGSLKQTSEGDTLFQVKKEIDFLEKGLDKMGIETFEGWTFFCLDQENKK